MITALKVFGESDRHKFKYPTEICCRNRGFNKFSTIAMQRFNILNNTNQSVKWNVSLRQEQNLAGQVRLQCEKLLIPQILDIQQLKSWIQVFLESVRNEGKLSSQQQKVFEIVEARIGGKN